MQPSLVLYVPLNKFAIVSEWFASICDTFLFRNTYKTKKYIKKNFEYSVHRLVEFKISLEIHVLVLSDTTECTMQNL